MSSPSACLLRGSEPSRGILRSGKWALSLSVRWTSPFSKTRGHSNQSSSFVFLPFAIPLAAYSASSSLPSEIIKRCEQAGADLVVCSPYQPGSLKERIQIVSPLHLPQSSDPRSQPACLPLRDQFHMSAGPSRLVGPLKLISTIRFFRPLLPPTRQSTLPSVGHR